MLDPCLRSRIVLISLPFAIVTALLGSGSQAISKGVAAGPLGPAGTAAFVSLDGFEDPGWPDPNLWQVTDNAAPTWWPSSCRSRQGARALWAFGGRVGGIDQPCGAGAPLASRSTVYQRLDLRGAGSASRLELYFDLWLQMPEGEDSGVFVFLHVPRADAPAERIPIFGATGVSGQWSFPARKLDLMNLTDVTAPAEVYDLRGDIWRLEWVALAARGSVPGAGAYIDDVLLVWEPLPGITPPTPRPTSPRPSATTAASATPSPTVPPPSPSPSVTPGPSASPIDFGRTYLPYVVSFWPPVPTATVTPSPDLTATASAATPVASWTPGPSPTAEATATATPTPEPPRPGPPILPSATALP